MTPWTAGVPPAFFAPPVHGVADRNVAAHSAHMHTGWRSRGYLPHCDVESLVQHIVFGLADALPRPYEGRDDPTERVDWAEREFDAGLVRACWASQQTQGS